ncbi:hypothetical protein [Streptomyces sp. NPDC046727]|uniref:hypothetical protein n=1 Tax=Streptomyces sp. NPDC046727 TaxID=3155373 RepID=UPI003401E6C3
MSVLSVPRMYFQGVAAWHPATMNNNDHWSIYDYVNADLDWEFFRKNPDTQHFTRENIRTEFPKWARTLREFEVKDGKGKLLGRVQEPPARWDYYGGMEWAFHSRDAATHITGTQTGLGGPVQGDGLVGAVVDMVGDPFPGRSFPTPARMTDTNPNSFWSSNFYAQRFQIGTQTAPERYLSGPVEPGTYMSSRWVNFQRNLNRDGKLQVAGIASTLLQVCLPKQAEGDPLRINADGSGILSRFQEELERPSVRGLMVRCTAYLTRYFTLPEFADCYDPNPYLWTTRQFARLVQLWNDDLASGRAPTQNPAVSRLVGTVGLWTGDDPWVTAPGGRHLVPKDTFTPGGGTRPVVLGPAAVETHLADHRRYATIDLGSTVPEIDSSGKKEDLGTLRLMLRTDRNGLVPVAEIERSGYDQQAYERSAGIVDVEIPDTIANEDLAKGALEVHRAVDGKTLLREREYTVETDDRSLYVDQPSDGNPVKTVIQVQVRRKGEVPDNSLGLTAVEYRPEPKPPAPNAEGLVRVDQADDAVFLPAPVTVTVEKGLGHLELPPPARPGFAVIAFFAPGEQAPKELGPVAFDAMTVCWASYTNVRALPFDNLLPAEFRSRWRSTASGSREAARDEAWKYLYEKVLCPYDVIYPSMKYVAHLDLGDRASVDENIELIVELADRTLLESNSTLYMPVSRELSEGKRQVLEMYRHLVRSNWAPDALDEE